MNYFYIRKQYLINNNCYHFSTNSSGTDKTFLATIDTTNKTNLLCVEQGKQIPPSLGRLEFSEHFIFLLLFSLKIFLKK